MTYHIANLAQNTALTACLSPPFLAGFKSDSATVAIRKALDDLPGEARECTLEALALGEKTRDIIRNAKILLSPEFFAAFLKWGEAASHFATLYEGDEEGDARFETHFAALRNLCAAPVITAHDLAVLGYIAGLDWANDGCFRCLSGGGDQQYPTDRFPVAVAEFCPVVAGVEELATLAWSQSAETLAIDKHIGAAITSEFTRAQAPLAELAPGAAEVDAWVPEAVVEGYIPGDTSWLDMTGNSEAVARAKLAILRTYGGYWRLEQTLGDHHPETKAASDAEYGAIDELLRTPARTAKDAADKLRFCEAREIWSWTDYSHVLGNIADDILRLDPPSAPPVAG